MKPREFHTPSRVDFFVVAAVAFATFANSLRGGFVFDDNQAIVSNADVLGSSSLFNVFQNDFWGSPISHPGSHRSYRPLTILSFRLNYLFGQLNPFGFHLANVLLHAIVSCFVLELSKRFFERRDSRLFSALLFAVHPVHSEAVANLVGRADLFAALVSLAAYLIYDKCQCPHTSALLCLFGLGFKETSIAVLPLIIVRALLAGDGKRHCAQLLAYAGILSILRLWINEFQNPEFSFSDNPIAHHPSFLVRTATFAYLPLVNLGLMLVPHKLCFDWSMDSIPPIKSFFDLRLWLTFGFYSLTSLATYNNLSFQAPLASPPRKRKRSPSPRYDLNANLIPPSQRNSPVPPEENESNFRIPLAVAFLVIPFLPASNIFTYVGFVVAERILYLPSVGFCLLIAMIYEKSGDYKKAFYVILVLFALRSVARNDDWNDEERLYRSAVEINPAKAFSNLGNVLTQKKRFSEALDSYQQALTHRPNMADTHYNMGVLYMDQNDLSKAIESYQNAIHFRPSFASAYLNLGLAFWNTKDLKQSEKTFQECGKVNGAKLKSLRIVEAAKTGCRYNLGRLLVAQDRLEEAVEVYEEAVVKMPGQYDGEASLYNMLGEAHFKLGRVDEAERWYQKAMEAKKDHVPVYLTMANLRIKENRLDEAKTLFLTALSLDSQNTNVYLHLGRFYSLIEDWNNALSTFETALLSHSNHPDLLLGAANALRQLGIHDRAEKLYEALVEVRPDATSFSNLGAILHLNKKHGKAEKFYEKALELNQKDEVTQKNLKKLRRLMRK